jgi:hypothetical protein
LQGLDKAHQAGQWRAQLVADVGHEVSPHLACFFKMRDILETDQNPTAKIGLHLGAGDVERRVLIPVGAQKARGALAALAQGGFDRVQSPRPISTEGSGMACSSAGIVDCSIVG